MATTGGGLLTAMGVPGPELGWVLYETSLLAFPPWYPSILIRGDGEASIHKPNVLDITGVILKIM